MTHIVDTLVVIVVLGVAVGYAVLALGPRSLRRRIFSGVSTGFGHLPQVWGVRQLRARMERAANKGGGACGGCDSCASSAPAANAAAPAAEVRVPVTKIGRRIAH